jgi:hypothetical protein
MAVDLPSAHRDSLGERLSASQRRAFRRYVTVHCQANHWSRTPLRLALVLAGDKPATLFDPYPWAFPERSPSSPECALPLLDQLDLTYKQIQDLPGVVVATSSGRLALLPTVMTPCNAYHRRLGVVFGYPPTAIEYFIQKESTPTTPRTYVEQDQFEAAEIAYTGFVFYTPEDSVAGYRRAVAAGKATRARLSELAATWEIPALETLATGVYEEYRAECSGEAI